MVSPNSCCKIVIRIRCVKEKKNDLSLKCSSFELYGNILMCNARENGNRPHKL